MKANKKLNTGLIKFTFEDEDGDFTAAVFAEIVKINYLLGYDASSSIFGEITATTITPDGRIFAEIVFEFISEKLAPEIAKRKQNMQSKMNKYTEKYLK